MPLIVTTNRVLAAELLKDADALQRVVYQYNGHPVVGRILEAARILTESAELRDVESMRQRCIMVAFEAGAARGEWVSSPGARQMAQHICDALKTIPLPLKDTEIT